MAEWSGMSSSDGTTLSGAKMEDLMDSSQPIKKEEHIAISSSMDSEVERSELHLLESMSFKQKLLEKPKLVEKPNLYLGCHLNPALRSTFEEHFHLSRTIEECNVGVVIISAISFTYPLEMVDLVRMVEEAKRRSDFKILPVMLSDFSLTQLDGPGMQEHIRKEWNGMEVNFPGSIKAADCAAVYEYIRSGDCMGNIGPRDNIEFWDLVFDRIRGLISAGRNTENLRGIAPPISTKDSDSVSSSEIHKVRENSNPKPMMQQSTSVNDPVDWLKDFHGETKNKSAVDSDSDKGYPEEGRLFESLRPPSQMPWSLTKALGDATLRMVSFFDGEIDAIGRTKARQYDGTPKSQEQNLRVKPNIYLGYYGDPVLRSVEKSAFERHFHLSRTIAECNVGVVIISMFSSTSIPVISMFSSTSIPEMMDLVKMVEEAKSRSDFKILPVFLGVSPAQLDDPEMQERIQKYQSRMEKKYRGKIKAADCAAAYKYIRSCDSVTSTARFRNFGFWVHVFDRIRGLISAGRNTENWRGITPPISTKDSDTVSSSEIHKVSESKSPTMMHQSTSGNDPDCSKDLGRGTKNKSADDSDSGKGDAEEEGISSHTFQTPPPIPHDPHSIMKDITEPFIAKSQEGLQMFDAVHLQLDTLQKLEDQVKAMGLRRKALSEDEGLNWRKDSSSSTLKDEGEITKYGFDESGDEICETIMKDDNLEVSNDPHENIEHDYEAFKDQLYEDIKRIDCIEEIAIDHVDTTTLLHSRDIVILSFFDEKEDIFEFYFRKPQDMASIVGVGLEHAVVILECGKVTIKEITDHDWNERWRSVETNSCETRKFFKVKTPTPLKAYEGLIHLDVELSHEKPLLWELTKYFSLRESIETFVPKGIFAKYAQGVEPSSSTSLKNQSEGSSVKGTWMWNVRRFLNGGVQENGNEGSTSNQIEERVMIESNKSATIVELELLEEGLQVKDERVVEPFLGTISSNLQFEFINDAGDKKDEKEIHITVGHVSFTRGRDKDGKQSPWYHDNFEVIFGLLGEEAKVQGRMKRRSFEPLDMKGGMDNMKTSFTHGRTRGVENIINGGVSIKPHGVGFSGGYQRKSGLQNSEMTASERGAEISNNNFTIGGLELLPSEDTSKIVCDYYVREVLSCKPPSRHYYDHHVIFKGKWLPKNDGEPLSQFVEYTLQVTREVIYDGRSTQHKYRRTILVNHFMTHLDGKTYKLREQKTNIEGEGKSILTESRSSSEFEWPGEPLVQLKDPPNEVTNATIEHVDQLQENNTFTRNSFMNRARRMVRRDRSTLRNNSFESVSRQEVNGNTSNPTRSGSMRW